MSKPSSRADVLEALGVTGDRAEVVDIALTHRSFAFEQPAPLPHNERLEWLGDAVVGLVVADLIYDQQPHMPEGRMQPLRASVVNTGALADIARRIGLGRFIRVGKGEQLAGGQDKSKILADTFESIVGAAYLVHGFDRVAEILSPLFAEEIDNVLAGGGRRFDWKGALQEWAVRTTAARPRYVTVPSGPDHAKRFSAQVYVNDDLLGRGTGTTKKEAELAAAREAMRRVDEESVGSVEEDDPEQGRAGARAS